MTVTASSVSPSASPEPSAPPGTAWICLLTQPRKEAVAASHVRRLAEVDAFCPRLSYFKKTRRGKVRCTEAVFPGYLFVRGDMVGKLRHLLSLEGVRGVVRYGLHIPCVPDFFIEELRRQVGADTLEIPEPVLRPGQSVVVAHGPFRDFQAIFSQYLPARERVRILLDFLGRQIQIDVPSAIILATDQNPKDSLSQRLRN